MAEEIRYNANTQFAAISTANPNLNGSGSITNIFFVASTGNGSIVRTITIKAIGSTTQGMIRLYINFAGTIRLLAEVEVPAITQSAINPCFEKKLRLDLNMVTGTLKAISASTQNSENFYLITEGLDWNYYPTAVRADTTAYIANTGTVVISTANPVVSGSSGALGTVLTAGGSGASNVLGCKINGITIKAIVNTTPGMVRLYVKDTGTTIRLLTEIPVPAVTKSSSAESFSHTVFFDDGFCIAPGYMILASTQNSEAFVITADAVDWKYLP